jgi:hypothetical protein
MFSLRPLDSKKGWFLFLLVSAMVGYAGVEDEAGAAVTRATCMVGIACVLWVIWQLMQYDHR